MNEISGNKDTDNFPSTAVQSIGGTEYGMRPLAINVSVTRTNDRQSLEMYDQKDRSLGEVESGTSRTE